MPAQVAPLCIAPYKPAREASLTPLPFLGVSSLMTSPRRMARLFFCATLPLGGGSEPQFGCSARQSAAAGGIAPAADLATGHEVTVLGVGTSASQISLKVHNAQAVVP